MSQKPDAGSTLLQDPESSEPLCAVHSFLVADYGTLKPVEVELVDYPVVIEEPQFEALVADSECEV